MLKKKNRFMELEGLRGIAAIVVVIYHAMIMFYPGIAYGHHPTLAPVQNMRFEDNLYGNPINVFLSGGFAVAIFFVLSGFVLSIGFFQTGNESIIKRLASKRYLRLMLPALVACFLAFLLIAGGFAVNKQATVDIAHSGSLSTVWSFVPHLFDALREGILTIFLQSGGSYDAVLWTMYYEFTGSFMVFITLLIFGKSKYRWAAYLAVIIATFGTWFMGIILGMVLADLYSSRFKILESLTRKKIVMTGILFGGLFIGGYPILSAKGTFYEALNISRLSDEQNASLYMSLGAVCVVMAVLYLAPLSKFLAHPKVSVLGRYTYSLYLTHTLVLYTLGTTLFVFFSHHFGINKSALFAVASTIPMIVVVTWLFERYIDAPSIKFANFSSDVMFARRELNLQIRERASLARGRIVVVISRARQIWSTRFSYVESEIED